jgi:hypothetical protein
MIRFPRRILAATATGIALLLPVHANATIRLRPLNLLGELKDFVTPLRSQ